MDSTTKHTYSYKAGFTCYGLAWHTLQFRVAVASFGETGRNKLQIVDRDRRRDALVCTADADVPYPLTRVLWAPASAAAPSLLGSSSDHLRLHDLVERDPASAASNSLGQSNNNNNTLPMDLVVRATLRPAAQRRLAQNSQKAVSPPLSSFDWNEVDPSLCVTSCIDTTCTVWDVNRLEQKTQLIAHDKAVYDVAFSQNGPNNFASVGADGSVRLFDLRALEHSTILYDTPPQLTPATIPGATQTMENPPLLRLSWNKLDTNLIATFQLDSKKVVVLDIREPSIPVAELYTHTNAVNAIGWAPQSKSHLCSVGDDGLALVWDTSNAINKKVTVPSLTYRANDTINNLAWTPGIPEWVGIAVGDGIQALKV
ncbi:UNVERIFIED_CONTAM: ddb1 and cul4 associated factor 7 [Siphonaria sp. JEL0065]|nr:ddb1 and cul4 associated factor 7 [Siphonaria sp. JEL0065]